MILARLFSFTLPAERYNRRMSRRRRRPLNRMPALARIACLLLFCAAAYARVDSQAANLVPQNDRRPLVFRGARLIVGDGRVIEDAAFVVRDGLLTQVGSNRDVAAPADGQMIDLRGKTVMPAIVNAHSHL